MTNNMQGNSHKINFELIFQTTVLKDPEETDTS